MAEYRCRCGRRISYDITTGKFKELEDEENVILKIRCRKSTKDLFKRIKEEEEFQNYESLLLYLISMHNLRLTNT